MSLATICLPIQTELMEVERELTRHTSSQVDLVNTAAQYILQNGGKRIRPALLLLTARMLGVAHAKAVPLSVAVEMIHAASLMHDDVLDNASLRRGKPSANVKWGNQISILVGDFLWCRASELAISYGDMRILSAVTEAVKKTAEGEILEMVKSSDFDLSEEEYLKIITLKTAMLFACSCRLGAILAGAPPKFEEAVKEFGLNLGIAFQLADDVLDYVSSEETFGKRAGTDLCEGRLTLPIILSLRKCSEPELQMIKEALLANTLNASDLAGIRDILKRHGAIDSSLEMARQFSKKAKESIISFKPSLEKDALAALADYAVSRGE